MSFELQLADGLVVVEAETLDTLGKAMTAVASDQEVIDEPLELCLRLTLDAEIRALNAQYRGKDTATDVLAFAVREGPGGEMAPQVLGDIVISVEAAARQRGPRSLLEELEVLLAHGFCHLLGYDHQTDLEEAEMNARADELIALARARPSARAL